jgi:SAM-dependent methyltransferase
MINGQLLAGFVSRHSSKLPMPMGEKAAGPHHDIKKKTSSSFGFQWNVFSEMFGPFEKNFLNYISPLEKTYFRGKLVLDAGCGFGRHTYYAAKYGAEVIGFDLSDAVEAAKKNCSKFRKVHIVQWDIYKPPFRKGFDFIMSIGVLHHLPEPEKGFLSLVGLMNKRTEIFAWLYGREGRWFKIYIVEGVIRQATKRMPHRVLYYLCFLPAAVYHVSNIIYNSLGGEGSGSALARILPFKGYSKFPFRVKHADAFDLLGTPINNYYTRSQVEKWAQDARLRETRITSMEGKSWRLFGKL